MAERKLIVGKGKKALLVRCNALNDMENSGNWNNNLSRILVIDNSQESIPIKGIIYGRGWELSRR